MSERNLVICDRDIGYADGLGENISMREDLAVKVYICSSLEKVSELAKEKTIHLFVVEEGYPYTERNQIEAKQVFVLGRGRVTDLGETECPVRKYQCADEIIREIFETYIDKTKENIMRYANKEKAYIVAVYSPLHRLGKTTFAGSFGAECAKKKKVLYLNLEEYAGFTDESGLTLGDLLYYLKQGNGNLGIRLQAAVKQWEGMDYILPIPVVEDLKEVSTQDWLMLLKEISENSSYELVILDVGESIQGLYHILESCDRIYMPLLEDPVSQKKLEQYDDGIRALQLDRLEHITHRFLMPEQVEEYARMRAKEEIV